MPDIITARLVLRELNDNDAAFVLELVNEPGWLKNIGDRHVRSLTDARGYIDNGPRASYARHGYGLYAVVLQASGECVGICGPLKRDSLPDADIGFAFLQRHWNRGYAVEAATATRDFARDMLRLPRLLAITALDNQGSIKVLEKIGFVFERVIELPDHDTPSRLFSCALRSSA